MTPQTSVVEARITPELRDAAKRASDIINTYITFVPWEQLRMQWIAVSLQDGTCSQLYDSKADAVRHTLHERTHAFVAFRGIGPGGSNPRELAIFLQFNRDAYDAGLRLPDPDDNTGGKELLMTAAQGDYYRRLLRGLPKGL